MPVSGNEETRVESLARQSSLNHFAGVPFKKRRFIRPPSPPVEEQSPVSVINDSSQKLHSSPSRESSLSNSGVGTTSSGLSDANMSILPEVDKKISDKYVQINSDNNPRVKIEEPCFGIQFNSLDKLGNRDRLVVAENISNIKISSAKNELNLLFNGTLASSFGREISSQQMPEEMSDMSTLSGNPELSLGLNEYRVSAFKDHGNDGCGRNRENMEHVSLNLSFSKRESSAQSKIDDMQSSTDIPSICTDRSNWDLNTTMDTWEGFAGDVTAGQVYANGSNMAGAMHDIKPSMCSMGIVETASTTERQLLVDNGRGSSLAGLSSQSVQQGSPEDPLHLQLSPSFLTFNLGQEPSSSSDLRDFHKVLASDRLPIGLVPLCNPSMVGSRTIKPEPFDESLKQDSILAKSIPMGPTDLRAMKHELAENFGLEALKSIGFSAPKFVDLRSIKAEPRHEGEQDALKTSERALNLSDKHVLQGYTGGQPTSTINQVLAGHDGGVQLVCSADKQMPQGQDSIGQATGSADKQMLQGVDGGGQSTCSVNKQVLQGLDYGAHSTCSGKKQMLQGEDHIAKPSYSMGLPMNDNISDHVEHDRCTEGAQISSEVSKEACDSAVQVNSEILSLPMGHGSTELNVSSTENVDNSGQFKLKLTHEHAPDFHRNGEGPVSEDEKVNLSGDILEEECCSQYESDGNSVPMDIEEDGRGRYNYEDGEVQEPQLNAAVEGPNCGKREGISRNDFDNKKGNSVHVEEVDIKGEDPVEIGQDTIEESIATRLGGETFEDAYKDDSMEESSIFKMSAGEADKKNVMKTIIRNSDDTLGKVDALKGQGMVQSSYQVTSGVQGDLVSVAQGSGENDKTNDVENNETAMPKLEASLNVENAAKDANNGGNRSRIINLFRASNLSSLGKTRSMPTKPLSLRPGRERLPDVLLGGDKPHPRGRDEIYSDGSYKFSRERHQDQFSRNSRFKFVSGRGRISTLLHDRDPDREFVPDFYNGPSDFGVLRHKFASSVAEEEIEFINYSIGPEGAFLRGGRKLLEDDTSVFRKLPSRRRSPGGRDGSAARPLSMIRRVPRNIGEEDSEVVGLRHAERVMRGFPDNVAENAFTHPQPSYEGLDGHFVQGNRNFASVERRTLHQMRTKSPGTWSSARRRSPDGFSGPPDLPHRRSPIYRMERMRSPDHPDFRGEMVARRHASPSYVSRPNDLRGMESVRDHGLSRSIISHRSPSGRVLPRNSRRFGVVGPRETADGDEFFGAPMHFGRFPDLGGDENGEERRRFGERQGPVRSFRPPFNDPDGESFHQDAEDGPRRFRFFQEDNPELNEISNLRGRDFDRRIKNRTGNTPRRQRRIEEQEGNYRHGKQVLYDNAFDEVSLAKRKRF